MADDTREVTCASRGQATKAATTIVMDRILARACGELPRNMLSPLILAAGFAGFVRYCVRLQFGANRRLVTSLRASRYRNELGGRCRIPGRRMRRPGGHEWRATARSPGIGCWHAAW
jgi:hypothetical protein